MRSCSQLSKYQYNHLCAELSTKTQVNIAVLIDAYKNMYNKIFKPSQTQIFLKYYLPGTMALNLFSIDFSFTENSQTFTASIRPCKNMNVKVYFGELGIIQASNSWK